MRYTKHYLGQVFYFPKAEDIQYRSSQGIRFGGWYSDKEYTLGPYTYRTATYYASKTYYARWVYDAIFLANDDEHNPVVGEDQFTLTFNAGREGSTSRVFNKMPQPTFTRPGYNFKGWRIAGGGSTIYNANSEWNFDGSVKDGKITFEAVWEPIEKGSTYKVEYYFEDLNGIYNHDPSKDTRFYSTAGNISSPSKATFAGYVYDNDYIDLSRIVVRGDGGGVVKLYYKRIRYNVTFNLNGGTLDGQPSVIMEARHSGSVSIQTPVRTGYTFIGWDRNLSNITSDFTVKAVWQVKSFNYTFICNTDGQNLSKVVAQVFDSKIVLPNIVSQNGKIFEAWYDENGTVYDSSTIITEEGDKTLYAYWRNVKPTNKVTLSSRTETTLIFKNYPEYEYQLVPKNAAVPTQYRSSTYSVIAFSNLQPNTEYDLYIRVPAAGQHTGASTPVKVGTFKTISAEGLNPTVVRSDTKITIVSPEPSDSYILIYNNEIFKGRIDEYGNLVFEGLTPGTDYQLFLEAEMEEGEVEPISIGTVRTKSVFGPFPSDWETNNGVNVTSTTISISAIEGLEYRLGIKGNWISAGEDGLVFFNGLLSATTYEIYVRVKETEEHIASKEKILEITTKYTGIVPYGNELNHIKIEQNGNTYIQVKPGFVYYLNEVKQEPVDNIVENVSVIEYGPGLSMARAETGIFDESESVAITEANLISRPVLSEEDKNIETEVTTTSIVITNPKAGFSYHINYMSIGERAGVMIDGKIVFNGLQPNTSYDIYVRKFTENEYFLTDWEYAKTVTTKKEFIEIEEGEIFVDYTSTYNTITIKTVSGKEYRYDNKTYLGDGNDLIISIYDGKVLTPATSYKIEVRIIDQFYESNWIEFYAFTKMLPADLVIVDDNLTVVEITDDSVVIMPLAGYEYAIGPVGLNDYSKLLFLSSDSLLVLNIYDNTGLDYATEYAIYGRKIADNTSEASDIFLAKLSDIDGFEINPLKTLKLPSPKVSLPTNNDIDLVVTNTKLIINAKDGFVYAVKPALSDSSDFEWKTSFDIDVVIGEAYEIYAKRLETLREEESFVALVGFVNITKTPSHEREAPVISSDIVELVTDDSIIIKTQPGLEYAVIVAGENVSSANWIKGYGGNYVFSGLSPNTQYEVYARYVETDMMMPSQPSEPITVTTKKIPENKVEPPNEKVNVSNKTYNSITIETNPNLEYSIDGINWIRGTGELYTFEGLKYATRYSILIRTPENEISMPSQNSQGAVVTTDKLPSHLVTLPDESAFVDIIRDGDSVSFIALEGYLYLINDEWVAGYGTRFDLSGFIPGQSVTLSVKKMETDKEEESHVFSYTVTTRLPYPVTQDDLNVNYTVGHNSVAIESKAGVLYAIVPAYRTPIAADFVAGNGNSLVFDKLSPNTEYKLYIIIEETEEYCRQIIFLLRTF